MNLHDKNVPPEGRRGYILEKDWTLNKQSIKFKK